MKKLLWGIAILAAVVVLVIILAPGKTTQTVAPPKPDDTGKIVAPASPENARYIIDGTAFTLTNGVATQQGEIDSAGQAPEITAKLFGTPTVGDLDKDGDMDAAVMLQVNPGGTGTFYYVAAAINVGSGYMGTNAIFIGDRIAPQTVEIRDGLLIANYADRKAEEPFSAKPTIGKSFYGKIVAGNLVDVTTENAGK